jgi:hypothetical protein
VAIVSTPDAEILMKKCQRGFGGRSALDDAHNLLAECYGTIGALVQERDRMLRGEFICTTCGLRKDGEPGSVGDF